MAFDTFVRVQSSFEARCDAKADPGLSLTDYMRLPVEQYVCIPMPLNATLSRMDTDQFNLTVPPVRFFHLDVSPMLFCDVSQTSDSVTIASETCILRGSKYVESLNGCYKINVKTKFGWIDTPQKKAILSSSQIFVEVDPPAPFKYFGKRILETTGTLAMSIALKQIENAFVQSLAKDYERWATDHEYRTSRASCGLREKFTEVFIEEERGETSLEDSFKIIKESSGEEIIVVEQVEVQSGNNSKDLGIDDISTATGTSTLEDINISAIDAEKEIQEEFAQNQQNDQPLETVDASPQIESSSPSALDPDLSTTSSTASPTFEKPFPAKISRPLGFTSYDSKSSSSPLLFLTDDICLMPGAEPEVRIEEAPQNARRIYTGVDILTDIETVWRVLTDYENLHKVVPSLIKNEVISRDANGGARLLQVGGAKVFPGITFKAKTMLDVKIYMEDKMIPPENFAGGPIDGYSEGKKADFTSLPLKRGVFPRPYALTSLPHRDITMQNVLGEGDFEHYQGVWRVQAMPNCNYDEGLKATRLTYAVEIKPRGFLPVNLIETRIADDLRTNLDAIRCYVEKRNKLLTS